MIVALAIALAAAPAAAVPACRVVDGDTLRCGGERVRLLAIDAPEMKGHCRRGRRCVPGDPIASRDSLARAMRGAVRIERHGIDVYGRTLATVTAGGRDLGCYQLAAGQAVYKRRYDTKGIVGRRCGVTE